jgi:site-specific recombinase XerC
MNNLQILQIKQNIRYLDAKEIKTIIVDLKKKKQQAREMVDKLQSMIEQENYLEAHQYQLKYDRHRFDSPKEYKQLPRFLKEHEVNIH